MEDFVRTFRFFDKINFPLIKDSDKCFLVYELIILCCVLRLSYDEVCVLLDCLTIARADKFMTLDTEKKILTPSSEEKPIEVSDKTLSLVLKKKGKSKIMCLLVSVHSL